MCFALLVCFEQKENIFNLLITLQFYAILKKKENFRLFNALKHTTKIGTNEKTCIFITKLCFEKQL